MSKRDEMRRLPDLALYLEVPYIDFLQFLAVEFPGVSTVTGLRVIPQDRHEWTVTLPDLRRRALQLNNYLLTAGVYVQLAYLPEFDVLYVRDDGGLLEFLEHHPAAGK